MDEDDFAFWGGGVESVFDGVLTEDATFDEADGDVVHGGNERGKEVFFARRVDDEDFTDFGDTTECHDGHGEDGDSVDFEELFFLFGVHSATDASSRDDDGGCFHGFGCFWVMGFWWRAEKQNEAYAIRPYQSKRKAR